MKANDAKRFLAAFMKNNPQIEDARWRGSSSADLAEIHGFVSDPKNWVRFPENDDHGAELTSYMIYEPGCLVDRFAETAKKRPAADFVRALAFRCAPTEDAIAYLVLEDASGNLHLGDYIGD